MKSIKTIISCLIILTGATQIINGKEPLFAEDLLKPERLTGDCESSGSATVEGAVSASTLKPGCVSVEDFSKAANLALSTAFKSQYGGSDGARSVVFGFGSGGTAIVNQFVVKSGKRKQSATRTVTLVLGADYKSLSEGYRSSINDLGEEQGKKALMLAIGDEFSASNAHSSQEQAFIGMWGSYKYLEKVLNPDRPAMKPTVAIIVATPDQGVGSGGLKALLEMAKRHSIVTVVFMAIPLFNDKKSGEAALESFQCAIRNADTVIPFSMEAFIKSKTRSVPSVGDQFQVDLFYGWVSKRLASFVESFAFKKEETGLYEMLYWPEYADFRAGIGIAANSSKRTNDGRFSVIASATGNGKDCLYGALTCIFRKLTGEYYDYTEVIKRAENITILIECDAFVGDYERVCSEVRKILIGAGFSTKSYVRVGLKVKRTVSPNKVPTVNVTFFTGGLDFGEKQAASSFGLADKSFWQKIPFVG